MEHTENYQLSQWGSADRILMEDFNADNAKLEAALAQHAAALVRCGNCGIESFSYTGNGNCGDGKPTRFTFSIPPLLFFVLGKQALLVGTKLSARALVFTYDSSVHGSAISDLPLAWNGAQASLTASYTDTQMNRKDQTYCVFAFVQADA